MKVKEPQPSEYHYFRPGLLLFTYLHLAANKELTEELMNQGVTAIAYENVQLADNTLPLLAPMSEIAGRMAAQIGAQYLQRTFGGKGILLAGVPGVRQGNVVIIGGGVSGYNAARMALGLGAHAGAEIKSGIDFVLDCVDFYQRVKTADLVIGAVLLPGHKAPTLVTEEMVASMPNESVIVDIAIDQGGIFATGSKVTTHEAPTYIHSGVIHYAVANMPGAVPQTSTYALSNATLPYVKLLASTNLADLLQYNNALYHGVNTYQGKLTMQAVAEDLNLPHTELSTLI